MKGEYNMSDNEKFQAFKQKMVQDQEKQYGEEARKKYGDAQVDEANKTLLNFRAAPTNPFKLKKKKKHFHFYFPNAKVRCLLYHQ